MQVDIFKEILVPVIGGLGIFMLGLEFMSDGINNLAVNRMRQMLAKIAGTPVKGLFAGTLITGVLQSSTAMTVMVVGLVNAGVVALRPAISVIMGANIGTTLGNGLIALPLGPLGLILAGAFGLLYVFSKVEKTRNMALALIGFSLIFYGLNLLTGGLKPLRAMPEVMAAISTLNADTFTGLLYCVLTAAGITALIHSSSATIGIVMGLGAAGVLDWQTAVAFSLGADLGTTITSWMASLNLSKNAKRAAYAHISFNVIGVAMMLPLFYVSMDLLQWVMGFFGGDPGKAVIENGKETFPLVPIAVGIYSTVFNIFNTVVLFPFIGVFERVLSRIGHTSAEDAEDYSMPRHLTPSLAQQIHTAVPAVQQEMARYLQASRLMLAVSKGEDTQFTDVHDHQKALDSLNREIRRFTATAFQPGLTPQQADLVASLIEEEDFSSSLGETLYQVARRVERHPFGPKALDMVTVILDHIDRGIAQRLGETDGTRDDALQTIGELRQRCLTEARLPSEDRGALLALLGSAERAFYLAERIQSERRSVSREVAKPGPAQQANDLHLGGGLAPTAA
ncbi:MAG: Na/Pi symporter [Rhizobacter sp.]